MMFTWEFEMGDKGVANVLIREATIDDVEHYIHNTLNANIKQVRRFTSGYKKVKINYCPELVEKLKIKNNLKKFLK